MDGQKVLDIGTDTGVLSRNMYKYGAKWTGTDIVDNQIEQAKKLADESEKVLCAADWIIDPEPEGGKRGGY